MKQINAGHKHVSAVDIHGNLFIWGSGDKGELIIPKLNKIFMNYDI